MRCILNAILLVCFFYGVCFAEDERSRNDCGTNSLFVLLSLKGCPTLYGDVEKALPDVRPNGFSISELCEAASRLGLTAEGVYLDKNTISLDGPIITLIQSEHAGHYVVLRPIGYGGTSVQVLDYPYPPKTMDLSFFMRQDFWTGKIIKPMPVTEKYKHVILLGQLCIVVTIATIAVVRSRSSSKLLEP